MIISKNLSLSWKLIISVLVCETVGFVSGLLSMTELNLWFNTINKPTWNIPSHIFGPIWTCLYFMLGVSFWLIWKNNIVSKKTKNIAQILFLVQLFFNFSWSILFFRLHCPFFAFIDVVLMIILTFVIALYFLRISQLASLLLLPYLSWISSASVINYTILNIN